MSGWTRETDGTLRDEIAVKLHPDLSDRPAAPRTEMLCICGHAVDTHTGYAPCSICPCGYGIGEAARDYGTILQNDYDQWAAIFAELVAAVEADVPLLKRTDRLYDALKAAQP